MSSYLFSIAIIWGAVAILGSLTILAWRQQPKRAAMLFAVTMFCGTWWATTSALGLFATADRMMIFWSQLEWAGIVFIPVAWLLFALEYTGRERFVTVRSAVALSVVPTVTLVLAMTNNFHWMIYESMTATQAGPLTVLDVQFGPWFLVHAVYTYGLLLLGTGLIVQIAIEKQALYSDQVIALVGIVTPPVVGGMLYIFEIGPFITFDPTPFTFILSGVAGVVALRRYRFLDAVPVTDREARNSLVDEMDQGVVVVDGNDDVVQMNPAARSLFPGPSSPVGQDVASIVPSFDSITQPETQGNDTISVQRDGHERIYEVRVTALQSGRPQGSGAVLVFHDVTTQRTRLQRLDVLNRVLRHNLRNEMNVMYGYADRISRERDPETTEEMARRIKDQSLSLVQLGDRARKIDGILERRDESEDLVSLTTLLQWELDRISRECPAVTVDYRPPETAVECSSALETILEILVGTVLEHNDVPEPAISIEVTVDAATARIEISDNGAGIPENERRAIEAGSESELRHGNGLDLWLTNWGIQAIGGELAIAEVESGGTSVTVSIPCQQQSGPLEE